ncbi:DUF4190 domain-containing protein [Streptomyces termitum]
MTENREPRPEDRAGADPWAPPARDGERGEAGGRPAPDAPVHQQPTLAAIPTGPQADGTPGAAPAAAPGNAPEAGPAAAAPGVSFGKETAPADTAPADAAPPAPGVSFGKAGASGPGGSGAELPPPPVAPGGPAAYGAPAPPVPAYGSHPYGAPAGYPSPYPSGYPAAGPSPYGYGPQPGGNNGLGTAGMVLGIIGVCLFWFYGVLGILLGVLALIFSIIGRRRANRGEASNGGSALAGIILGAVSLVLGAAVLALFIWFVANYERFEDEGWDTTGSTEVVLTVDARP